MKILPIITSVPLKNQHQKNVDRLNVYGGQVIFAGSDSFKRSSSLLDTQLSQLNEDVQNIIIPFNQQYKEKFLELGKIGYESQEKLKLVREYETQLMNKKFGAMRGEDFEKALINAKLFEKYNSNLQEFNRTVASVQEHPTYATDEISRLIKTGRAKMLRDDEYFKTLKPFYDKYIQVESEMESEFEKFTSKNIPDFAEKVQKLDEQNREAVMLFLISGYTDAAAIKKQAEALINECKNGKVPFDVFKQIENINYKIQKFEEASLQNSQFMDEIDNFLEKNKNYKAENLSENEIHDAYKGLLSGIDNAIGKSLTELKDYNNSNSFKPSPRIIDRTFKSQARMNKMLNRLIEQEKTKFYSGSNLEY